MARSRMGGRKGRGYYKFTAKRKAALKKAQFVSAKNRKGKGLTKGGKIAIGVGVLAGVGAIGVIGIKNRDRIGSGNKNQSHKAVNPDNKERTRAANAISVGHPSRTVSDTPATLRAPSLPDVPHVSGPITDADRARANATRQKEKDRAERPMRNIDSDKAADRQVKGVLKAVAKPGGTARLTDENKVKTNLQLIEDGLPKAVSGRKSGSYRGTPGGTQTPKKAVRPNTPNGLTEAEHQAAIGFDTELYAPPAAEFKRSRSILGAEGLRGDPMQALRGIRAEDEKLLNPEPVKKAAKKPKAKKPKAPTAGTNKTADAKPKANDIPKVKDVFGNDVEPHDANWRNGPLPRPALDAPDSEWDAYWKSHGPVVPRNMI